MPRRKTNWPATQQRYIPFTGGLNEVDPQITMPDGMLIASKNYEVGVRGGYRRIDGYERYDGGSLPSEAKYWIIDFDSGGPGGFGNGDDVLNNSSAGSATAGGTLIETPTLEGGSYAAGDGEGFMVLTQYLPSITPETFNDNDTLFDGAGDAATANGIAKLFASETAALDQTRRSAAVTSVRSSISVVPGEGDILGVHTFNGSQYAFRNNVGSTEAKMFVASTSGWSEIDLGGSLNFTSGGTSEPSVGDTITGDTSSDTAIITRIQLNSGTWAGGDAAGVIHYRSKSGAFTSGENFDSNNFTMTGTETDTALTVGGRYRFYNANFTGHSGGLKVYGVDGVNKAFEFDGTSFIQITTGMTVDAPTRVVEHKKQLHLAFTGGSIQQSSIGDPHTWSVVTGASEIATADEVTDLLPLPGDVLGVFDRNRTYILSGSSGSYVLKEHSDTTGAIAHSVQRVGDAVYVDDRGIVSLSQTEAFGDFQDGTLSQLIQSTIIAKKSLVVGSCVVREKNQYRVFFSDKTAIYVTFDNRQLSGMMPVELDHKVTCISSEEDAIGNEVIFFGSTDGYVYKMDSGPSFDGERVRAYFRTNFMHMGTPGMRKRFRRVELETQSEESLLGTSEVTTKVIPALSYEDGDAPESAIEEIMVSKVDTLSGLNIKGTRFSGNEDAYTKDGFTASPTNSKTITVSFVLKIDSLFGDGGTFTDQVIFWMQPGAGGFGTFGASFVALNFSSIAAELRWQFKNAATSIVIRGDTLHQLLVGETYHILISGDAENGVSEVYIDGVNATDSSFTSDDVFNVEGIADIGVAVRPSIDDPATFPDDYSGFLDGFIANFWLSQEYIDFTDSANIEKFYKDGEVVDLGADGSLPTGTAPLIYLTQTNGNNFKDNQGLDGGAFTERGIPKEEILAFLPVDETHPRMIVDADGTGQNISVTVYSFQDEQAPHTVYGATIFYTERRRQR